MLRTAALSARWRTWVTGYGRALVATWGIAVMALAVVAGLALYSEHPRSDFTRDTAAVARLPPYVGLLSNLGMLVWTASAVLALTTAALLLRAGRRDEVSGFFTVLGLLTCLLLGDDLFMLHEWVLPYLGLPGDSLLAVQACALLYLLYRFRAVYLEANLLFLGSALAGFGAGVMVDAIPVGVLPAHFLLEDGCKFFGIVNWLAFTVQSAFRYLHANAG